MSTLFAAVLLPLLSFPLPPLAQHHEPPSGMTIETGFLSQYAESPTIGTIEYRQTTGEVPEDYAFTYAGFIAVADCGRVGDAAFLSIEGGEWLPVLVFDCSGHASTTEWMEAAGIIAEVDYYLAERFEIVGEGGIEGRLVWVD